MCMIIITLRDQSTHKFQYRLDFIHFLTFYSEMKLGWDAVEITLYKGDMQSSAIFPRLRYLIQFGLSSYCVVRVQITFINIIFFSICSKVSTTF